MKIKTWYLFLFIIVLFGVSFFVINLKFDPFYRVNGINNDNRVLIERYLDEDEQEYLVDNQISIDLFIKYIRIDDFHLRNYEYYNLLDDNTNYSNKEIVSIGNNLATRLEFLYNKSALDYAALLVENSLQEAFLDNDQFDFEYINIYNSLNKIYDDNSFIDDTLDYITMLNSYGIGQLEDLEETFEMLCKAYTKEGLQSLLTISFDSNVAIVFDPTDLTTIVDEYNYIGKYSPKELVLTLDIPRVKYSMYLQRAAYNALNEMYNDLKDEYDKFLLYDAFESYDTIQSEEGLGGYDEKQLGLTICISQIELAYDQFEETELSAWLEEHAYEYGYILRYPKHKASDTNHSYDAHYYRYVGKDLAKTLHSSNLTLEEYLEQSQNEDLSENQ